MPKNSGKKSKGNNRKSNQLQLRDEDNDEHYAEIIKALGSAQFMMRILNGDEVVGKLKGSMQKGRGFEKVTIGNWVLAQKDPCTTGKDKYYITHRYNDGEKKQLEKLGELVSIVENTREVSTFVFEGDAIAESHAEADVDDAFINDI